ncbi:MAG TPA: DUF3046 domain-containing protein [Pseudonocardiaceae bacterium]|jgi:hypothetical protein|nr:DUF3046 domain-containing protein [Pseudonocardiaceae bacterium]
MRITVFRRMMDDEFGEMRAASISADHVFAALGGTTVDGAIDQGIDPRLIWQAVCEEFDVPDARR